MNLQYNQKLFLFKVGLHPKPFPVIAITQQIFNTKMYIFDIEVDLLNTFRITLGLALDYEQGVQLKIAPEKHEI